MNEQFINELATALRKVGTIHTVGEEWVSYIGEIPVGGVPYCGQEVTRTTYSALWAYAQSKGLVKTETEWQQIATDNSGNVPFYSNGDGSTTFRMPKLNSSNVTPETSVVLFGVYAFGVVTNVGELDVSAIARDVSDAKIGLNGVVRSINGLTADASGEVSVVIPPAYILPVATSSVVGGVKVGSNITISNGKISLNKSNVTSALGYTPVKSVNGTSVDANGNVALSGGGVTSLEGMTGDLMIWGTDSVSHSQSYTHSKYADYTKTYTYTLPRSGKTTISAYASSYAKNSTNSLVVKVGSTTVYSKSQATPNLGTNLRYNDTLALQKDTVITVTARGYQNTDETHSSLTVRIDYYDVRESFY